MYSNQSYAATIGMFDGVHRGHQFLVQQVKENAAASGLQSMIVTMERHPREVITGEPMPLLTPADVKLRLLQELGTQRIVTLQFTRQMAAMTARDFMQQVLREKLGVKLLVMGYNHRFGCDGRSLSLADYREWGSQLGIQVVAAAALDAGSSQVSSSAIRKALMAGDVETANLMLGRSYQFTGRVVHGNRIGRQLGFPTANLVPDASQQLLPKDGVYAVQVTTEPATAPWLGMMNIGTRPTIDSQRSIEVHIIGFSGQLYGHDISVSFLRRLRDTQQFDSPNQLQEQLQRDLQSVLSS